MKHLIPPGTYYLGDPYYVFDQNWYNALRTIYGDQPDPLGYQLIAFGTAYGDGTYFDQHAHSYPVDAGLIGLVPVQLIERSVHDAHIIVFQTTTECWNDNGILHFGDIIIDTVQADEEDE